MTCTVTMLNESSAEVCVVNAEQLQQADYQFATPFVVDMKDGSFIAEQVVRLIPGKRMVVFGLWKNTEAVAKLFFDKHHAERHCKQDRKGVQIMTDNKIPTPELLAEGTADEGNIHALIFTRIQHGADLETLWRTRESNEAVLPVLQAAVIELATQHVLGVMQKDMHMGNFLLGGKVIYTLDGGELIEHGSLLPKDLSMKNLALFLSQLGAGVDDLQDQLFHHYARARGWLLKAQDRVEMKILIKKWNESRWQSYERKIFRNSTDFMRIRRLTMRGMMRREFYGKEFNEFIQQPDAVFARQDMVMLKNGRSSTVISVTLDGRELVIKRYNLKHFWHRLRRALRVTRACKSWRLAQKMNLFYVQTAKPVAYLESNFLGVRGQSYFVSERVNGSDVKSYLRAHEGRAEAWTMIRRVVALLRSLARLEVTHGDLKASNILINDEAKPVLIDLDGASEHVSVSGLRKTWRDELQRFLRNFDDMPAQQGVFRQVLENERV